MPLDLEALEQEAQTPYDAQPISPKIPRGTIKGKKSPTATNIPSQGGTLSQAQLDARLDAIMAEDGIKPEDLNQDPEQVVAEPATARGVFGTLWDYGKAMPKNTLVGAAQFGANVSNVSKEAFAAVFNKFADKDNQMKVTRGNYMSPQDSPEARTWAKMAEISTPTMIGAGLGSVAGPVGTIAGGVVGAMIGNFIQEPNDANLSTALQETKYAKMDVLGPILNFYAHKPGDSDLMKRTKNMLEGTIMDLGMSSVVDVGVRAAKSRVVSAAKAVMKDVSEDVRIYSTKKVPAMKPSEGANTPQAVAETIPIASESDLAAKEALYTKQGEQTAHEFATIVADAKTKNDAYVAKQAEVAPAPEGVQGTMDVGVAANPGEQLELATGVMQKPAEATVADGKQLALAEQAIADTPAQQMDFFELMGHLEDVNKARRDALNLDAYNKEVASNEFGTRQAAKQKSLFRGRTPRMDDPRLSEGQIALFDIDDVDTAGFSYDPKQASFFDKEFNNTIPDVLEPDDDTFIKMEQIRQDPSIPKEEKMAMIAEIVGPNLSKLSTSVPIDPPTVKADGTVEVPAAKENGIKITLADDGIAEKMIQLDNNRKAHYAEKRELGQPMDYSELQGKAFAKNNEPGEAVRILNLPPGYNPTPLEMAQIQDLYARSYLELVALEQKVLAGTANDLELVAYKQAQENHYNVSAKYYSAGTDAAHSLGIRRTLRDYARGGDPLALKLIGNEGKIKSTAALIQDWGGRAGIQDDAKFYSQVMEVLNNKNSTKNTIGKLNSMETREVIKAAQEIQAKPDSSYIMGKDGEIRIKSRGRTLLDGTLGYMFDNMVLSPITIANTVSGIPFDMGMKVANNYTMAALSGAKGDVAEMVMRFDKANRYSMSLVKNFKAALKAGAREFSGTQQAGDVIISTQGGVPEYLRQFGRTGMQNANPVATAELDSIRKVLTPTYGWTIGMGRKLLATSDAFVNHLGYNAHLESELLERGWNAGMRGDKLQSYIEVGKTKPPVELHDAALAEGAKLGYRADVSDLNILGMKPLEFGEDILYRAPILKVFSPFFRSYGNTVQNTLEYLPGLTYALKSSRDNLEKSLAKQVTGTGALIGLTALYMDDQLTLPDFFNQSPYKKYGEVDEKGNAIANQPMAVRHADGTTTKLPWGGALQKYATLAGYIAMMSKYSSEEEVSAYIKGGAMAIGKVMAVEDQFRAYDMLSDLVTDGMNGEIKKGGVNFGVSVAERFLPFNRIGKLINQAQEESSGGFTVDASGSGDINHDALDYVLSAAHNRLKAILPGQSSELPPEYNILFEPVPAFGKGLWSIPTLMTPANEKSSAVMDKLATLGLHASMYAGDVYSGLKLDKMPKTLDIGGIPVALTAREYARLNAYAGGFDPDTGKVVSANGMTLREALTSKFDENKAEWEGVESKNITPAEFNKIVASVHEVITSYKNAAKEKMKNEPSIIKKINDISDVNVKTKQRGIKLIDTVIGR